MNYVTPYDIGIGDDVVYQGKQYMVYLNYIKGALWPPFFCLINR